MSFTLVILAAGLGSRYGGLKQLDEVGPRGETMLDYSVWDAVRAGFDRVMFVIRRDFEAKFRAQIGAKYTSAVRIDYAFQTLDSLPSGFMVPAGRTKPWGTGHATWCARTAIKGSFAVINADDFYGQDSFTQLAAFLRSNANGAASQPLFASVGFRLANTLSENGAVSRGLCGVRDDGLLDSVTEHTGIRSENVGPGLAFSGQEVVSMNCWGFTPALFPALGRRLEDFLRKHSADPKAEFYLPAAVSDMIATGEAKVQLLPTNAMWLGITYREDRPRVMAALAELERAGRDPAARTKADGLACVQ